MATAKESVLAYQRNTRVMLTDEDDLPFLRYNDWQAHPEGEWLLIGDLSGSYYSGGFVCRSNYEVFLEEFPDGTDDGWLALASGGHQTYAVLLNIANTPVEAWERLDPLDCYPILDDERMSELESNCADECWDSWGEYEWKQLCAAHFDFDVDAADDLNINWREHFERAREASNQYWEAQGDERSMYVDMKRCIGKATDPRAERSES